MLSSMYLNIFQPTKHHSLMCLLFRLWSRRWTGWGCWWTSRTAPCRPRWTRWRWAQQLNTCCRYFMYKQCNVCILYQHLIFIYTSYLLCLQKLSTHFCTHHICIYKQYLQNLHNISTHNIYTGEHGAGHLLPLLGSTHLQLNQKRTWPSSQENSKLTQFKVLMHCFKNMIINALF